MAATTRIFGAVLMKVSVDLINSYLGKPLKTQDMVSILDRTEVEVDEILYADSLDNKIITACVVSYSKHPNADRLSLVSVDIGSGIVEIVCGANNLEIGMIVALAQVGTTLPSGDVIERTTIRGQTSSGMLCSELELERGNDHSGIISLDPSLPLGKSLCDIDKLGDILDIKTPSNRWDYMSYIGLAREISAVDENNELKEPDFDDIVCQDIKSLKVKTKVECKSMYLARVAVKANTESPKWLVDNLVSSGIKSINPVVDITNFVMLEYGQPSHAYDANKIVGSIEIRSAKSKEALTTLDGKEFILSKNDIVIADEMGVIGLAGVVGAKRAETTDASKELLIEVASLDKTAVRRSALNHKIRTEASSRFEKGLPLPLPRLALSRIVQLLKDICGAEVIGDISEQIMSESTVTHLGMRLRKAEIFLGYKLDGKQVENILTKRGFATRHFSFAKQISKYSQSENLIETSIIKIAKSIYRDAGFILGEVSENILAEGMEVPSVGLKVGDLLFSKDNSDPKKSSLGIYLGRGKVLCQADGKPEISIVPVSSITKSLNYLGARRYMDNFNHIISIQVPWWRDDIIGEVDIFEEIAKSVGYSAMPESLPNIPPTDSSSHQILPELMNLRIKLAAYGLNEVMTYSFVSKMDIKNTNSNSDEFLQIENPLSSEQDYLRTGLLASHLRVVAKNSAYKTGGIFEISRVYTKHSNGFDEKWVLAVCIWGESTTLRIKGVLDSLLGWYKLSNKVSRMPKNDIYISGRAAKISKGLGSFGQVSPGIASLFGVSKEVSFIEIEVAKLIEDRRNILAKEIIPYQLVKKDITVEVKAETLYTDIRNVIDNSAYSIVYQGEFQNEILLSQSRKRVTIGVEFDLGPNPSSEEITQHLSTCIKLLGKIPQAQVL